MHMLVKFWGKTKTKLIFYNFCPPAPKHSCANGLKLSDTTVKIEEFAGYDS